MSAVNGLSLEAPESVLEPDPINAIGDAPREAKQMTAALFDEQHGSVCRYLVSLGLRPQVAGELAQETFLRLYRHLRKNGSNQNLRGWIFRVAHNLAMNELSRAGAAPTGPLDSEIDPEAGPEGKLLQKERIDRMQAAIRTLPRRQQQCLHLRAEGLRYREIAQVLGMRVSTVREALQRALQTLARLCHE